MNKENTSPFAFEDSVWSPVTGQDKQRYKAIRALTEFLVNEGAIWQTDAIAGDCHGMDAIYWYEDECKDTDVLHFCRIFIHEGTLPRYGHWDKAAERRRFERACRSYLVQDPGEESRIVYDRVDLVRIDKSHVFMRLQPDALPDNTVYRMN